jgi:hypothetical protein
MLIPPREQDDFSLTSRLDELLHQAEHSAAETIVLVGHSHFFREVFRRFLHPTFHLTDPHLARTLQSKSIPNCTVLACEFDFAMRPYVIRHVNEIRFAPPPATRSNSDAAERGKTPKSGGASRPAGAVGAAGASSGTPTTIGGVNKPSSGGGFLNFLKAAASTKGSSRLSATKQEADKKLQSSSL